MAVDLRYSAHRAIYFWLTMLGAFVVLILLEIHHGGPPATTAFPNRADTPSDSAGDPALGAGLGDVGDTKAHP